MSALIKTRTSNNFLLREKIFAYLEYNWDSVLGHASYMRGS